MEVICSARERRRLARTRSAAARRARRMRDNGDVRGQTSALVDGTLLLDCGPEAPPPPNAGRSLAEVRHLLLTHAHPDHTGPVALMWRGWVHSDQPLDVAGPPAVIEDCRVWIEPDATISWHELRVEDVIELGPVPGARTRRRPR